MQMTASWIREQQIGFWEVVFLARQRSDFTN